MSSRQRQRVVFIDPHKKKEFFLLIQPFCMALDSDTQKVIDMAYFVEFIPVKKTFLMSIFSTILKGKLTAFLYS